MAATKTKNLTLDVYYDCNGKADMEDGDERASQAAGRKHAKGTTDQLGVRHLEFAFATEAELNTAKFNLKEDGFRFFP